MKVHLRQIPPDGLHIEGDENANFLDLPESDKVHPLGSLHYSLNVGTSGGGLFATGNLALDVELECASCLKKFRYPLRIENFAMQTELTGAETVDLTPFVREDILLALPPYPHCDWNGENVCKGAARNFANEINAEPQPSSESQTWAELDKLNLKKK